VSTCTSSWHRAPSTAHSPGASDLAIAHALSDAISSGGLRLAYQPIVSFEDGSIAFVEALTRWRHQVFGAVEPERFVSVAERCGLISVLGQWALETACTAVADSNRGGGSQRDLGVAVNVSARQLERGEVYRAVESALDASGLAPACLALEVTESALVELDGAAALRRIRDGLGVRLVIDDFGSGYSSLASLLRSPFDVVKLDRSLVHGVMWSRRHMSLLAGVIAALHDEGMAVVAEGVESGGEAVRVRAAGADFAQGLLFSEPLDATLLPTVSAVERVARLALESAEAEIDEAASVRVDHAEAEIDEGTLLRVDDASPTLRAAARWCGHRAPGSRLRCEATVYASSFECA